MIIKYKNSNGFTIVELLIVIVVIGILAAITIVAYRGIQARAQDTAIMSDINLLSKRFEIYKTLNGAYPVGDDQLKTIDIRLSKSAYSRGFYNGTNYYNVIYCRQDGTPSTFSLVMQSASRKVYTYRSTNKKTETASGWTGTDTTTICTAAGIDQAPGYTNRPRDILYEADAWKSYVK